FSFKKSGEMIGTPRVTFTTSGVPADTRDTYLKAINDSLSACIPLKFTGGLGGALAGRPIAIRYVDNRELGTPAGKPWRYFSDIVVLTATAGSAPKGAGKKAGHG